MPVRSTSLANDFLAGVLGPNRGSSARDSHRVRLWSVVGTSEADWNGYTPPTWSADDWTTPEAGVVYSDGLVDFDTPSGSSTTAVKFWSLHDVDDDELLYSAPLVTALSVTATEDSGPVQIRLTVPVPAYPVI
jgi:hypothetical protein